MKRKYLLILMIVCLSLLPTSSALGESSNYVLYTWGSRGETVKKIQQKLKLWGYYSGNISGIYDYDTFNAVKEYQKTVKIEETGYTDSNILKNMGISDSNPSGGDSLSEESKIWLMASLIEGEGKGLPYHGKVALGAVVINRVNNPTFPDTISSVIYQSGEFPNLKNPTNESIEAARDAYNGFDPSNGAVYFWERGKKTSKEISGLPVTKIISDKHFGSRSTPE